MAHRIVFAGAGSIQFAPALLGDLVLNPNLGDVVLVMHDIDAERLDLTHRLALRMQPRALSNLTVEATTDPDAALVGADFVIVSIELDRFERWDLDRSVPAGLGIPQALGENGGPGGLFHALRMIPGAVELAHRVESICPNALVLNLTNPLSRICQAVTLATDIKLVGLCHEIHGGRADMRRVLGLEDDDLRLRAAGLNHFTWFTDVRDGAGVDQMPRLRELAAADPESFVTDSRLLTSDIFRATGAQCVTNDSHAGEYLRGGHRWSCRWTPDREPLAFYEYYREHVADIEARVRRVLAGEEPIEGLMKGSGEEVIPIIEAVIAGRSWTSEAINVVNGGRGERCIPDLPAWAIVEVPGRVDADGGHGEVVDDLPDWIMALCSVQVRIHRLTARAALEGDKQAALEALFIDPSVPDLAAAEAVLDALLEAHRAYLPMFQ
jgi:alpha-galactosidase